MGRRSTHRAVLEAVEADFVLIVVPPPYYHREIALAALQRGLPVLTEKPLDDTMASAKEMVAAAEAWEAIYDPGPS